MDATSSRIARAVIGQAMQDAAFDADLLLVQANDRQLHKQLRWDARQALEAHVGAVTFLHNSPELTIWAKLGHLSPQQCFHHWAITHGDACLF